MEAAKKKKKKKRSLTKNLKFSLHSRNLLHLKGNVTWKCRKKKRFISSSLKFVHDSKGLHLKEKASRKHWKKKSSLHKFVPGLRNLHLKRVSWKRRKKHHHSLRLLFYIYDWDPGFAPQRSPGNQPLVAGECCDCYGNEERRMIILIVCSIAILFNVL